MWALKNYLWDAYEVQGLEKPNFFPADVLDLWF